MTVAFDVGPLRPKAAGVGVYVRSLAQGLAELGRIELTFVGRRPDAEGLPPGIRSFGRSSGWRYPVWVEIASPFAIRRAGASLTHFTDGLVPLIGRGRTIVTVLDLSLVRHWRLHRAPRYLRIPFILAAPRLADRVIAISQATADEVMRLTGTAARKIDVIPLAPRSSARPASGEATDTVLRRHGLARGSFVLAPGTIEPRKNLVRLVAAFENLVRRQAIPVQMELVIAGQAGWKAERTLQAIEGSAVSGRIKALGYVAEDEMAVLMTAAGAVAYVSTYEGFGLPVVEAMACGASVVTSNVSSMPEAAGGAGVLVDPFDPGAIAAGILTALAGGADAKTQALARAARSTWTDVAEQTLSAYARVQ